jgi:1-deoxy-D-xylulose-5-phosphate synthase
MNSELYPILGSINSPADLRELDEALLPQVADELRRYLIASVASSGGHFGAGLGCVELTVALHFLYQTPWDRIVWDVGHQAYPHKILCERARSITTIKQRQGLAPFPKREESEYDTFGTGHSSTSISAALGMAVASAHRKEDRKCVAVIGDGAMTAGMAYEALNHGGDLDTDLLVVLNENQMSISPNVGALTKMLGRLMSGPTMTGIRERGKSLMQKDSRTWRFMSRWEEHLKGMVMPSTLFEELGFNYLGPIDGHDLPTLIRTIRTARDVAGPNLLHIITEKGKGYEPAEKDPVKYHAVGPFDPAKGVLPRPAAAAPRPTYTDVFGQWLCDMAEQDDSLLAITPAMREGSGMVEFHQRFPERFFDVGIAEQHSVTLAAGMACENTHPVVAIYSTFLQRAYDQLIHDVALQNLPVLFAIDRAGLVGPDGPYSRGQLRPELHALHSEHGHHGAGRRERVPPDALYGVQTPGAGRRALPPWPRSWRARRTADDGDTAGQVADFTQGPATGDPRLRQHGGTLPRNRRAAGRHADQHAFRQTAGPRGRIGRCGGPREAGDGGGECRGRRRRQCDQ